MKLKDAKDYDVFVRKINSEDKAFDGRYLLVIRMGHHEHSKEPMYWVKITKNKEMPNSVAEINEAEFIIKGTRTVAEARDFQRERSDINKEFAVDEFGYVYIYRHHLKSRKGTREPEDFIYIGNFDIDLPKGEYIDDTAKYYKIEFWEKLDETMIRYYKTYNQKDPDIFNVEKAINRKNNYIRDKEIREKIDRETKIILEKYGKEIEEILAREEYTEDSLTDIGEGVELPGNELREFLVTHIDYEDNE